MEPWENFSQYGDGSLRGEEVSGLATPYADMHAGSFFPLAHENPVGGKNTSYYAVVA